MIGYHSLWLGMDHLLSIDSKRFSEDYKRFYFDDIQAIITRKTVTGKIQNLFLGLFCGFFMVLSFSTGKELSIFFWIMAGAFFLAFLINWFSGPTCKCHLQTAVQTENLPSLHRLKTAIKTINLLRPLIEKAQGTLTSEALKEEALKDPKDKPPSTRAGDSPRHEPGTFHNLLFCFLLAGGLMTVIDMSYNHVAITLMDAAIVIGATVLAITALVKQHESDITRGLKTTTWITLGYVCFQFVIGYVVFFVIIIKDPKIMSNQWEMIKRFSALTPNDNPWLIGIYFFSICCGLALGVFGLTLLKKFQNEIKLPVTEPPALAGASLV